MPQFNKGDRVRRSSCIDAGDGGFVRNGETYTVSACDECVLYLVGAETNNDGRPYPYWPGYFELVTPARREFKVGDVVRCIDSGGVKAADWELGKTFTVESVGVRYRDNEQFCCGANAPNGVYSDTLELVSAATNKHEGVETVNVGVSNMELGTIKNENLVEAKKQFDDERKNAEIEFAKNALRNAIDSRDALDREIAKLEERKKPLVELIARFG